MDNKITPLADLSPERSAFLLGSFTLKLLAHLGYCPELTRCLSCKCPIEATRYHSLLIEKKSVPAALEVTAWTREGEIMGVRHRQHPTWGVQFHPESIMTLAGKDILKNFLALAKKQRR